MKKYLMKIFSLFLAIWMVTITGGLHLYAHTCACCDVQEVALTGIDACCSEKASDPVCCQTKQDRHTSCCKQTPATDLVPGPDCSTNNCCSVSHSYLKLDENFNTAENLVLKPFTVLPNLTRVFDPENNFDRDFQKLIATNNTSPPGFTGKAFLIFTHTLKVPLFL
jgi:hypothetical protein